MKEKSYLVIKSLKWIYDHAALVPVILMLFGISTAVGSLYLFAEIAEGVLGKQSFQFDSIVNDWLDHFRSPFMDQLMFYITELGSVLSVAVLLIGMIAWLLIKKHDKWSVAFFLLTVSVGGALNALLKHVFERSRPEINEGVGGIGFSFPSGHAMGAMIFYGFLGYLVIRSQRRKRTKLIIMSVFIILILLIGISRIYFHVHYPTDVIAGYAAGASWLYVCIFSLEFILWMKRRRRKRQLS
ncbi:phosphatase PAP2 family protein [Bacillus taeanensis]|uniref:PAP2 family protein n=1 Tax=Bacillus taeanensis TaxID=273032 RepID=A0A366XT42_9BACI|nr:phosphatase PAP2 family protein [Bacillus taeanensis]RBW69312.1 PAP2 family protein [Bacillus taeanensis]